MVPEKSGWFGNYRFGNFSIGNASAEAEGLPLFDTGFAISLDRVASHFTEIDLIFEPVTILKNHEHVIDALSSAIGHSDIQ